jgi:hypothetical protein
MLNLSSNALFFRTARLTRWQFLRWYLERWPFAPLFIYSAAFLN